MCCILCFLYFIIYPKVRVFYSFKYKSFMFMITSFLKSNMIPIGANAIICPAMVYFSKIPSA